MIPRDRAALFAALAELCHRYPDWRFGQLVSNVSGWADVDVWDIEDEKMLAVARGHLDQVTKRGQEVPSQRPAAV
jgi:hypothetical protein